MQTEYRAFVEAVDLAAGYLSELIPEMQKFLLNYMKSKNYDNGIGLELDTNLLYIEKFYQRLDEILVEMDNVSLLNILMPKAQVIKMNDYVRISDKYEQDIYADLFQPLDIFNSHNDDE